jgi:RHS repeat-associated protein
LSPETRTSSPDSPSDTRLVNVTVYDDAGRAWKQTDPRGIESRTTYDMMGRTTKTVENYVNGTPSDTDDKTADFAYFGPRLLFTLTAQLTSGSQETKYIYGVSSSDGSKIASNDLLRETRWPDKSTGAASASEVELSSYNALGQRIKFTDRNETVHDFSFDVVGRPTKDAVTLAMGSSVDSSILRHETSYDSAGRAYQFTSYDAASGGNIVNQVERALNGLGQIISEYQSHSGAVTGSSPKVQYTYTEMASGANHSRLTSMIYPDTWTIGYNYASGLDNVISRLTSMTNSSTTLEGLAYLGLGTVVERTHPEPDMKLSYIGTSNGEAGDKYVGLDRFGRIIDQWWKTSTSRSIDRFKYGYDRNSNRLFRTNETNTAFSELYHADGAANGYDGLNQLSEFQRGVLSDTNSDMIPDTVATASRYQTWDPDAVGNFEGVNTDGANQARTHNKQNQSTVVGGNNLTFDDNGNMTTDETGRTITFDAWNRLVKINSTTRYANDALGRRIKEGDVSLFYSTNWQVLEEYSSGDPVNRYVWSPVYVDAMVLRDSDYDVRWLDFQERLYVTHDANFNVTSLVNTGGNVVERFVYDPYGRFDFKDASYGVRASSSYGWVYLHQGGRFDATAALFHFRNRDFSPTLMRWASVDPIGFRAGDGNLFRYVANNGPNRLDPSGTKSCTLVTPVQMINGPTISATASAGIVDLGPSFNPSVLSSYPVYEVVCTRTRYVHVRYSCVDTLKTGCFFGSQTYTYLTWLSQPQTQTYRVKLDLFIMVVGVEIPIPGLQIPGVGGMNVTFHGIDPRYQEYADSACRSRQPTTWPPYAPPATST